MPARWRNTRCRAGCGWPGSCWRRPLLFGALSRMDVLERVRDPLQFHRGRLSGLHARGDRQYPRVLSCCLVPRRRRWRRWPIAGCCRLLAAQSRAAARAGGASPWPPRSRCPSAALLAHVDQMGSDRQRLCQRTGRQRPVHLRRRVPAQRAGLRALLRDDPAGGGGPHPGHLGVERKPLRRPCSTQADEHEAQNRTRPFMPRPPRHVVLITVESLSAEFLGSYGITPGLTPQLDASRATACCSPASSHRHAHRARTGGAVARHAARARTGHRAPARQRASVDDRRIARAPGLRDAASSTAATATSTT